MKKTVRFFIVALLLFLLAGCSNEDNKEQNTNSDTSTNIEKVSTQTNIIDNTIPTETNTVNEIKLGAHDTQPVEQDLATFSTNLGGKDSPRSRNIKITTSTLNGTTVEPGQTFSFCGTIGVCTAEKGYEEADTFDHDGNKIQTLGGGNCQVSSTLYNAVLAVPELKVVERHAHSKQVHYVPVDKDAAVSYGSVDFKFKNTLDSTIKIYADSDLKSVTIRLVTLDNYPPV